MRSLPVIPPAMTEETSEGSLGKDGHRRRPYPADVSGRLVRLRRAVYAALIALWAALPWVHVNGNPAVFLDVDRRRFYLFGSTFNAQDVWLAFFALTGFGFSLLFATALFGRIWCGFSCPQTVFLEAVFRPIERFIHGPRTVHLRRKERGGFDHLWRVAITHGLYLLAAVVVAHVVLAYFVSMPGVFALVRARPTAHLEAFVWTVAVTAVVYGNFAFFREQLCVVVCPYGRLQSVLIDDDSLVVGYDARRGEPRGKAADRATSTSAGDCVDCKRCVMVCPTGIDIRQGLQLDCVGCTACIDACDEIMEKLGRPRGLIRWDSLRGLRGEPRRFLRPRIVGYCLLLSVGGVVGGVALRKHEPFEVNIVRLAGAPYTREGSAIRNAFELHLVNKRPEPIVFSVEPEAARDLAFVLPMREVRIEPLSDQRVPVFVTMERDRFVADQPFTIVVRKIGPAAAEQRARAVFLGAR